MLLVIVTIFQLYRTSRSQLEKVIFDDEIIATHIHCVPEIIHSYNKSKNVYGKKNTFFFRYSNNSCSSCINDYLIEILTLQEEIGKEYVWIFPSYPDDRGSRIQLKNELAKYNYLNIPADSLLIPLFGGELKSYFAWINEDGEISMVFIPDRNNVHKTSRYFLEVKNMLKNL